MQEFFKVCLLLNKSFADFPPFCPERCVHLYAVMSIAHYFTLAHCHSTPTACVRFAILRQLRACGMPTAPVFFSRIFFSPFSLCRPSALCQPSGRVLATAYWLACVSELPHTACLCALGRVSRRFAMTAYRCTQRSEQYGGKSAKLLLGKMPTLKNSSTLRKFFKNLWQWSGP